MILDKKKILELGIYELRAVARELGVPSPTSKKRQQLLDYIDDIALGKVEPQKHRASGRPYKELTVKEEVLNSIKRSLDSDLTKKLFSENAQEQSITFEQEFDSERCPISFASIEFCGIIRQTPHLSFYVENMQKISSKQYVLLSTKMVKDRNLKVGDYIEGIAADNEKNNFANATSILTVNNCALAERVQIVEPNIVLPNKEIGIQNMLGGHFKLICNIKECDMLDFVQKETLNKAEDVSLAVLALEQDIESLVKVRNIKDCLGIISSFEDSEKESYEKVVDAINYILSQFNNGKHIVLFVCGVLNIATILDNYFKQETEEKTDTQLLLRKLVGKCRAGESASISIVALTSCDGESYDIIQKIKKISK